MMFKPLRFRFLNWWLGDPAKVPNAKKPAIIRARSLAGLKPWPNLPDTDYLNSVNGTCRVCGCKIHGGEAIEYGPEGTRCGLHFTPDPYASIRR